MNIIDRVRDAWNVFTLNDPPRAYTNIGRSSSYDVGRNYYTYNNRDSLITAIFVKIAVDVAANDFRHVRLNEDGIFDCNVRDSLNRCFTIEANKDQTGRAFIQSAVEIMLDQGHVVLAPIDTNIDVYKDVFEIYTMRTGRVVEWFPDHVKVKLYNDRSGEHEEVIVPKQSVAIVANPFYSIMNERNSLLQRLLYKMNLLDKIDEANGANKIDVILQLPYAIKSSDKRKEAKRRIEEITDQLKNSEYGIAYVDGTEHITQLNRAIENNLPAQIEYLTAQFYAQLGFKTEILDGSADEQTMLNYQHRVIETICNAIVDECNRKFFTSNKQSLGHVIKYFNNPFRYVPVNQIADIADKFTRNEIFAPNEVRQIVGVKPSTDPQANELRNRNISQATDGPTPPSVEDQIPDQKN